VDRVGNIFARRPGTDDHLDPVLMGSHLDTQFAGGKYDGIVGVLAGLEVLRTLDDQRVQTRRPLELVCWTNEEGARFTPPMVASGAFAGVFDVDWVLGLRDDDGKVFGGELERIGYNGKAAVGGRGIDAYFELHIEQGPILDREAVPVGIVVGGYATRGMHVDVLGETAHAGPTPMDRRRNALVGAAMLAVAVNDVGWKYHATEGKATVARMVAWPNKAGILSEYAQLTCDVRHAERAVADRMIAEVKAVLPECARRANVEMRIAGEWQFGNERFDPGCLRLIREAAERLHVTHRDILSQAGHDAYYISRIAPTAMIFTPCRDGISHNEAEHAELDYTSPGVSVLLHAVLARANR
jgi:N-carbamoyl-L-amino-acid hydrolase